MDVMPGTAVPGAASRRAAARWALAAVLVSLVMGGLLALPRAWGTSYLRGDSPYYFVTAVSLLEDHDLDLGNQLPHGPAAHSGQISRDTRGRFVPKHPILLAVLALPLIAAWGTAGALAFNLLQAALLVALAYRLALRVARPAFAAAAAVLTAAASFWPHYLWNFSPDLLAALLVLGGVDCLLATIDRPRPLRGAAAGLLFGASICAKLTMGLPVACALLLGAVKLRGRIAACLVGFALPLSALALLDAHLFGSPWITSYDRVAFLAGGVWRTETTRSAFVLDFGQGAQGLLVDREHGLLWTSPVAVVALALLPLLWRRRRDLAVFVLVTWCGFFALFSKYRFWDQSHYGNRFLFLPVMLSALPLAAAFEAWRERNHG
jgi:hypothetical protein